MDTWNDTDHIDLGGRWTGWRLRGNYLVTPDGDRMTPERVTGLAWRDSLELRRAGFASRRKAEAAKRDAGKFVRVVVVSLAEYRLRGVGAA
ncbi:MAG: DUF3653 domain-containing protein [Lysobacter sp.]